MRMRNSAGGWKLSLFVETRRWCCPPPSYLLFGVRENFYTRYLLLEIVNLIEVFNRCLSGLWIFYLTPSISSINKTDVSVLRWHVRPSWLARFLKYFHPRKHLVISILNYGNHRTSLLGVFTPNLCFRIWAKRVIFCPEGSPGQVNEGVNFPSAPTWQKRKVLRARRVTCNLLVSWLIFSRNPGLQHGDGGEVRVY